MKTIDIIDDSFHGTPRGYADGCRGAACPAVISCGTCTADTAATGVQEARRRRRRPSEADESLPRKPEPRPRIPREMAYAPSPCHFIPENAIFTRNLQQLPVGDTTSLSVDMAIRAIPPTVCRLSPPTRLSDLHKSFDRSHGATLETRPRLHPLDPSPLHGMRYSAAWSASARPELTARHPCHFTLRPALQPAPHGRRPASLFARCHSSLSMA